MVPGEPTNKAPFRGACVCEERNGRVFCDNFVAFPYLDSVNEGDGGLIILPGSHKSKFTRPPHLFGDWSRDKQPDPATDSKIDWGAVPDGPPTAGASPGIGLHKTLVANITPQAGDILIMPEATCHGVLPWRAPAGQRRRILSLRFHIQHGELWPYRQRKGVRCAAGAGGLGQCLHCLSLPRSFAAFALPSQCLNLICHYLSADFPAVQRAQFSPETLELLLGAPEGHVKVG